MKHTCINCHFLAKEYRDNGGKPLSFTVSEKERKVANQGDEKFVNDTHSLKCHMGVWDEGLYANENSRIDCVSLIKRNNKCFYFPFDQSMMFDAAKELQKREQEFRQLKSSHMYTRIGLWLSSIALIAHAVIGILRLNEGV